MTAGGYCFVHLRTDEGIEGLGMSAPSRALRAVVEHDLKDILLGADPFDTEGLWQDMFWRVRGFGRKGLAFQAISAVDIALWDLKGQGPGPTALQAARPLPRFDPHLRQRRLDLLQPTANSSTSNFSYVQRGMTRVKMKVGMDFGTQPEGRPPPRRRRPPRELGDDIELYIDANNGYTAKQAIGLGRRFEEYGIGWYEEPVLADDIDGLARIARRPSPSPSPPANTNTPNTDSKTCSAAAPPTSPSPMLAASAAVTEWMKVAHLADAFNIPVASHAYQLVHLHLALATPNMQVVECLGTVEAADRIIFTEFPEPRRPRLDPQPRQTRPRPPTRPPRPIHLRRRLTRRAIPSPPRHLALAIVTLDSVH